MHQHARILGISVALIGIATVGATNVGAAPRTAAPAATKKPAGYSIASATYALPNGLQTSGSVTCPVKKGAQTVPFSGGVLVQTDSLGASLNSSSPTAHGWSVAVNNASGAASQFTVYAVCAKKPKGYIQQVSGGALPVLPGSTVTAHYNCPKGDLITGGGGFTNTSSTLVSLNSSWPQDVATWGLSINNFSTGSATITMVIVCAKLNQSKISYEYASGSEDSNPAGQETATESICGTGLSVLGGGSQSIGPSTSVSINSSFPFTGGWLGDVSNTGTQGNTVTTFVVCAA
jgi:hypothetical protein